MGIFIKKKYAATCYFDLHLNLINRKKIVVLTTIMKHQNFFECKSVDNRWKLSIIAKVVNTYYMTNLVGFITVSLCKYIFNNKRKTTNNCCKAVHHINFKKSLIIDGTSENRH